MDNLRKIPASETLDKLVKAQKAAGITRLANITDLDKVGLPIWSAIRPSSLSMVTSLGKGLTDQQSKISAMMESIEIWHAETISEIPQWFSPQQITVSESVIAIDKLQRVHRYSQLPKCAIPWIKGFDLVTNVPCWVPLEPVSLDMSTDNSGFGFFKQSSHGLSGGNSLEEAQLYALLEILERDSLAFWERNHGLALDKVEAINMAQFSNPQLQDVFKQVGNVVDIGLWQINQQDDLPIVTCMVVDKESDTLDPVGICSGYSAHPNLEIAVFKSLTEAVQARCAVVAGAREDLDVAEFERSREPQEIIKLRDFIINLEPKENTEVSFNALPNELFEELLNLTKARGCEQVIRYDLSKKDSDIFVVKLLCPGLNSPQMFNRA